MADKEKDAGCLGFTLNKVLQRAVPTIKKKQRLQFMQKLLDQHNINLDPLKLTLVQFITTFPLAALEQLQTKYNIRLVVVRSVWHKKLKKSLLLFDGRHAILDNKTLAPIHCFVLNKQNGLHLYTNHVENLPILFSRYYKSNKRQQPLHSLLEIDSVQCQATSNPQNKQDLVSFLRNFCPPSTKVFVNFQLSSQSQHIKTWYETPTLQDVPVTKVLTIKAFTNFDYAVVYCSNENALCEKATQRGKQINENYEKYLAMWQTIKEKQKEAANPFQDSRTSSISLSRRSLNLAYDLGIIQTQENLMHLSIQLAKTQSSLYVFVDDQLHLRHVTYYDIEQHFSTQVPCFANACQDLDQNLPRGAQKEEQISREKSSDIMLSFWRRVWQRRQRWVERRRSVLKPIIDHIGQLLVQNEGVVNSSTSKNQSKTLRSPYSRCLMDLKQLIDHQNIYMYSRHDSHMHCIKFFLADFAYSIIKNCRGVSVKASTDSTLTMLSIPGLTVINLQTYFDCKEDQDFFSAFCPTTATQNVSEIVDGPKPSDIFIKHSEKNLSRHPCLPVVTDNQQSITLNSFCKQKGLQWSKHILQYWVYFGTFLLKTFGHEIHGHNCYPSASYLGFQCVWTAYAKMAGPFAHSLEKTKAFYEDLIRQVSKGGFMFSIEDVLNQGSPLWQSVPAADEQESENFVAQSIAEMDLISAYGYSASLAYMPSGFCTGFKLADGMDKNCQHFERLDSKARHRSFEFRAVYKTLLDLTNQGVAIRTVYSNFSPYGIFCLGPYPIDLAVITQTGQLFLFQMDGVWCHGCISCPPLKRYLNGQTHAQVREMTNRRDFITQCWIDQINAAAAAQSKSAWTNAPMITYTIIQDCHTPGFSPGSLELSFYNEPFLKKLVEGYAITDECGFAPTFNGLKERLNSLSNNNYTFIALASVNILNSKASCNEGPLIVYEPREDKYTRQSLASSGCVVLTRDYYNWLIKTFGSRFQINSIEWILFYSTEPTLNQIYSRLTQLRSTTDSPVLVSFLKRMINLSCGFYGVRSLQQDKTNYRLVNSLPQNYAFYRHYADISYTVDLGKSSFFLLATKSSPKEFKTRRVSQSALPIFLTVVEYGKLRLIELLHFIQFHVKPMHFRLLYSNIDNIIFGLANVDSLEDAIHPNLWLDFCHNKKAFLAPTTITTTSTGVAVKPPGMAELKWIRNGHCGWKFVTMRTQHYCLVVSQHSDTVGGHLHKTSGWTGLSSVEAYQAAINILQGKKTVITQTRRINKKSNMETQTLEFMY